MSWSLRIGSLVFILVFAFWFYSEWKRISSQRPTSWVEDHVADCGVVLTGGPGRVREGFDLLAQGQIKKLIISGVHPAAELREIFPEFPFYSADISESDIILEKRSGTTYGNAQQSLVLVEALRCRDVVLVTSYLHMYRAHKTFRGVFPEKFVFYNRSIVSGSLNASFFDLFNESLKSLFYSIWAY